MTQLYEPATGAPLAEVELATTEDVDRAVAAARAALGGDWRRAGPTERSRLLHALADALVANRKELAELEARNVGQPISSVKVEVGIPEGVVNVVPGDGPTVGAHLVRHPGVDMVAFTGSTATGAEVMRLAADPLKRVMLELGGKSPSIVFADANLDDAVASSAWAIFYSAGQSCEARSRLLVESSIYDDVVARVTALAAEVKVGDPLDPETQMGSLISTAHRAKVHDFVTAAAGEVTTGGELADGAGAFYPPTVIAAVDHSSTVAQEEVFGPVVVAIPFEDEADAVRLANDVRYGLMATVWTGDPARGHRVAQRLQAGAGRGNKPHTPLPRLPLRGAH